MKISTLPKVKYALLSCMLLMLNLSFSQVTIGGTYGFESSDEGWSFSGTSFRHNNSNASCFGDYSLRVDTNTSSYVTSPSYDISAYDEVDFSFCHIANGRQDSGSDGFTLEYYDGSSWTTIATYTLGTEYTTTGGFNPHNFTVNLVNGTYTFPTNAQFRLRNNTNDNRERNWFDGILVEGTLPPGPEIDILGNTTSIADGDTTPDAADDTDFGNVDPSGGTNVNTFTIENLGTTSLSVGAITISGTHAADFSVTASPASSVAASGSTSFDITFNPSAFGTRTASVSIVNGDSDENPYNFDIEGNGAVTTYSNVTVSVDWPSYAYENTLEVYAPDNSLITTITSGGGNPFDDVFDLGCLEDLTNYYIIMYDSWGDGWNGADNVTVTVGGTNVEINQNGDAADPFGVTVNFDVYGGGPEMDITGNSTFIADGDTTPDASDDTDFGTVNVSGGTSVNTFTIENLGCQALNLTGSGPTYITISGTHAADFTVTANPSTPIAASGNTTFNITFDPSTTGLRTATISISNDDSDESPYNFNIQGTGISPGPEINILGNATSIADGDTTPNAADDTDFGNVDISGGTNANTFTIENNGTSVLSVGAITISGANAGDFSVTASPAGFVSAGNSTTFEITFNPSAIGTRSASVSIVNGDSDENPYNFDIEGNGTVISYSNVTVSVDWPSFAYENTLEVYAPDNSLITTITSGGGNPFDDIFDLGCLEDLTNYYIIMYDSWGDGWNGADNVTVTVGGTNVEINQNGDAADPSGVTVNFDVYGGGPEMDITGNSTSIADGDTTPDAADDTDFGNVNTSGGTNVNTFTIENLGCEALNLTGSGPTYITISGTHAADFSVTANPSTPISSGANTTFNITFDPSAAGLRTATISISNDDSDESPYNFNIQGTGISPGPEINILGNATSIADGDTTPDAADDTDFGNVDISGGTNANTFTIENNGTTVLSVGAITISGANAGDFSVTASPAGFVSAGNSTTFEITFNPSAVGARTASVSIVNNDSDENPYNFDIEGNGTVTSYSNVTVSVDWPSFAYENTLEVYAPDNSLITTITSGGGSPFDDVFDLGCLEDLTNYYIIMYDSWGDGWNGADNVTVTVGGTNVEINQNGDAADPSGVTVNFDVYGGGPEMDITGNSTSIADGDTTPDVSDDTDFGSISTSGATNTNTFTIENLGCYDLNLTGSGPTYITISGTHAADFSVTANPSTPISSGANTTFNITFDPSAAGLRTATISISNDDSDESPYNFNIQGTGVAPGPEIDILGNGTSIADGDITPDAADDTDFGSITITGATNPNTFTIENNGTTVLSVGAITISGANAGDFSVTASPAGFVSAGNSTTFEITFDPSAVGVRTASVSIVNNDSDENPYNFDIEGIGTSAGVCVTTVSSFPYEESFESGFGLWSQGLNVLEDDFDWSRTTGATPTVFTGPTEAAHGSYYLFTESNGNNNNKAILFSPCFDLTSATNPRLTFFYHMHGSGMGELNVELSTDNGLTYPNVLFNNSGETHEDINSSFTAISIDLTSYVGQTVKLRLSGDSGANVYSDMAIDMVSVEDKPTPTVAPGGVTADLSIWLKADDGLSYTSGQNVTSWIDQGLGSDARVNNSSQAPTYYDNATKNVNFNPVIEFDNSYGSVSVDGDYSHDSTTTEFLSGDYGFYTQEIFVVVIPDDTPVNNSFGYMDLFCSDAQLLAPASDATGLGFGNYTGRVDNEVICYAYDSYDNDPDDGYGVAQTGGASYDNVGIINTRNNRSNSQQELYYNANDIEDYQNDLPEYMNANDSRWWLGRSEGWEASLNARVAEVITYSARKNDVNLTDERNKIQSYLGIKYGITLGVNGTSQDYVDSDGTVIWDQSSDSANYNYDIAGIGRDDASELNQKQSRSVNNASDVDGRTEGVLTIGLTDIYDTNKLNQSDNPTTLNDKEFLMWGNNGANLNLASSTVTVNMSADITPALSTNVSFTAMQRVWKVEEVGGDIPTAKVRIPQDAIRNITPPGNYYMFISSTGVFDPTADYRVMTSDGNGNLETEYDFDNTKFITFGYAPQIIVERSIYFDGAVDYVDMEDALDLNPAEFTISAWIKRDAADSGTKSIVSKRNTAFTDGYDFRILNDNTIEIFWKNGSDQNLISDTSIPDDEWHHVAVTYNGSSAIIYIDGVEDKNASKTAPVDTNESFYIAAAGKGTPTQHFRGNIDEVRVWDRSLTPDQLRFVMNQEIADNSNFVSGSILPTTISKNEVGAIPWSDLAGYYPMSVYTYTNTEDASGNSNQGALRNLNTVDRQTAPLPYESTQDGEWDDMSTWANGSVQTVPGTKSIVDESTTVDWNIIRTSNDITIDSAADLPGLKNGNRTVLGLIVQSNEIEVSGITDQVTDTYTGFGLTVSHYLNLTGTIDLEGESQLIQTENSDLLVAGTGRLERDQQGTADTYTYNYWSSPVGDADQETNEFRYTLEDVMQNVGFVTSGYDGNDSPLEIADYWIWKFANLADGDYSAWQQTRSTGDIDAGQGFTMKGPGSGDLDEDQNYIFRGKPNNGHIDLTLNSGNNYLVGNPYPSAIDAVEFINDNLGVTTGTLYFWEHWGGGNHVLADYQGGYAQMNLSGGTPSVTLGVPVPGISNTGSARKTPGQYIPVGQGFFVDANTGGQVVFENDQRVFQMEDGTLDGDSVFLRNSEANSTEDATATTSDDRMKFRIGVYTVNEINRQLLLTIDPNATTGIDLGYDGLVNETQMDDMFWLIDGNKYVIQGSDEADTYSVYPLGIKTDTDGINTISINALENVPEELDIFVHDIDNNLYHNLRDSDYDVFLNAGEYLDRFEITFRDANETLGIDDNQLSSLDIFYSNELQSLVLLNPNFKDVKLIEMFNVVGQSIHTIDNISERDYSEYEVKNLSSGTYIVKMHTGSGSVSKKVLVK